MVNVGSKSVMNGLIVMKLLKNGVLKTDGKKILKLTELTTTEIILLKIADL